MAGKRLRQVLAPRLMNAQQTADYLGRSLSWFQAHRPDLERNGFPQPVPFIGSWDRRAVDHWLDRQGGLTEITAHETSYSEAWRRASDG